MKINKDTVLMDGDERIHPMGGECGVKVGEHVELSYKQPICGEPNTHVCENCGQWMCDKHTMAVRMSPVTCTDGENEESTSTYVEFCHECIHTILNNSAHYKENL